MPCSNCYNGCPEVVSDKCVKYTGIDVDLLGIKNGDSLSYVEQSLISFLSSTLDGTGIKIDIPQEIICTLVQNNLPTCGDLTAAELFNTLIKCVCDLQTQISNISSELVVLTDRVDTIEGGYSVGCLTGVNSSSGTHDILQAVITKLCAFITSVPATYVKLSDLDSLIQAYLDTQDSSTKLYTKMVPYTVVEYYGTLDNFDITGAGLGQWEKIYLCNGNNGTPDKRGRVAVGVTTGVGGGAFNPAVDPAISGNPTYTLNTLYGANNVTLSVNQIPSHTHTASVTIDDKHNHDIEVITSGSNLPNGAANYPVFNSTTDGGGITGTNPIGLSTKDAEGWLSVSVSNSNIGGGLSHNNVQPSLACYYIMYIP